MRQGHDLYLTGLRNQHGVERQAVQLLERQVGRLEGYPEMADRIRSHIAESEDQARRIEEILDRLGSSASSLKDTVLSFVGNLAAMAHAPSPDEVLKNTLANFAFEHYEIASYKALIVMAEQTGAPGVDLLQTSLREEEAMAAWIDGHLRPTVLTYIRRAEVTA